MGRDRLSNDAYSRVADFAAAQGSATHAGEKRERQGLGLHDLVNPAKGGVIRRSRGPRKKIGKYFKSLFGTAMLVERRLDTTGSMGDNVDRAMKALPKTYDLLKKVAGAVLGRYDVQMITAIFADAKDRYILCRSMAEMDERIAEQMTYMFPEKDGKGNGGEDPQYGLFGGAYLTSSEINRYGLKYYDFTITDEPARDYVDIDDLKRVFGNDVMKKVQENGHSMSENELPSTQQIIEDLSTRAHTFLFLVGDRSDAAQYWPRVISRDRIIRISNIDLLPYYEAAIIGLTEGTLSLQTLENFLVKSGEISPTHANQIVRAVAGIPIGLQRTFSNFDKIPKPGDKFVDQDALWPIGTNGSVDTEEDDDAVDNTGGAGGSKTTWL